MTNEEVIEKLVELRHMHERRVFCVINDETDEALGMAIAALENVAIYNGNTLTIKVTEEDMDKVKRIMLDNKPFCRMFYEDAPGEASWIREEQTGCGPDYCNINFGGEHND